MFDDWLGMKWKLPQPTHRNVWKHIVQPLPVPTSLRPRSQGWTARCCKRFLMEANGRHEESTYLRVSNLRLSLTDRSRTDAPLSTSSWFFMRTLLHYVETLYVFSILCFFCNRLKSGEVTKCTLWKTVFLHHELLPTSCNNVTMLKREVISPLMNTIMCSKNFKLKKVRSCCWL